MKFFLILFFFLNITYLHSFEYIRETQGKRKVIKSFNINENKKFINFVLDGTFTDNLGNFGFFENAASVILDKNEVTNLESYGRAVFQNEEVFFTKGYRNRQEQNAGAGTFEIIGGSKRLSSFIGKKCNYAVKFYKDYVYLLSKCNISEKQKKILEEINN